MSNPYARIFRTPGTKGFSAAAFVGRLPIGAIAATFTLANAVLSPQISRLVDRFGQTAIVGPTALFSIVAFAALILAANRAWPAWTLYLSALMAATMPSISAMVRARWSEIFRDRPELNTAFAFESAADELIYIAGAALSVGLAVSVFPEAGMIASTAFLGLGTLAFLLQRRTEPKVRARIGVGSSGSAIRLRAVQIITLALIFVGAMFATAEVGAIAITAQLGEPGAASLVIGVYAVGSFLVGLVLGAVNPGMALQRQLFIAVAVLAVTAVPLLFATGSVVALAVAVFFSGIAIAPAFITAFGLIERRVPESMLTEGVTWVMTGIGMALGAFAAGWVVDTFGPQNAFWVSVTAGAASFLTIALGQKGLSGERAATPIPDVGIQPAE